MLTVHNSLQQLDYESPDRTEEERGAWDSEGTCDGLRMEFRCFTIVTFDAELHGL